MGSILIAKHQVDRPVIVFRQGFKDFDTGRMSVPSPGNNEIMVTIIFQANVVVTQLKGMQTKYRIQVVGVHRNVHKTTAKK